MTDPNEQAIAAIFHAERSAAKQARRKKPEETARLIRAVQRGMGARERED